MQVRTRTTASFFPIGLVVLSMVADSRLTVSLRHVTGEHWEVTAGAKYPGTCRSTVDFYFIEHSSRFTLVVHVCQSSHYPQTAVSHYLVITSLHRSGSLSLWTNLPPPSVHILAFIQLRSSGYRVNHPLFTSNFPVGLFSVAAPFIWNCTHSLYWQTYYHPSNANLYQQKPQKPGISPLSGGR